MKTYTALTIGPIYKTLGNARHMRELWAASYTFSYLMKNIVEEVKRNHPQNIILPHIAANENTRGEKLGEGLYPDRLIYWTENGGDAEILREIVHRVLDLFASSVAERFSWNKEKVTKFFESYFRFYIIETKLGENEDIVNKLNSYLNVVELQDNYSSGHERFLDDLFRGVNTTFLVEDGYGKGTKFVSYQTLVEISAKQFEADEAYQTVRNNRLSKFYGNPGTKKEDDAEEAQKDALLIQTLRRKYREQFKAAHKYVAIVSSDGDNVGKIVGSLKTEGEFKEFSEDLSTFAFEAARTVHEHGGMPIYAGGDDLLFFAPVINGANHVIKLLSELDKIFIDKLKKYKTDPPPSLSFGASISYYKFPLFEALEASRDLLHEAKDIEKHRTKHNVALRVMKHSGQTFDAVLHIGSEYFDHFKKMLEEHVEEENDILSSVVYKIHENEELFSLIGRKPDKVGNFIYESFNEPVHETKKVQDFLGNVEQLISDVFIETQDDKEALDRVYTMLRAISFFKEKDDR